MLYPIIGNNSYLINEDYELYTSNGSKSDLEVRDGHITIEIYGYQKVLPLDWLYDVAMNRLEFPESHRIHIFDVIFKDMYILRQNIRSIVKIPFFKKPVYYTTFQGEEFYLIAQNPMYSISKSGRVLENNMYREIERNKISGFIQYPSVMIPLPLNSGYKTSMAVHRLVAMTFIENDDYVKKSIVDHINGNKNDCRSVNLRWVDTVENILNQSEQGLRGDNKPVLIRNIATKEIKWLPSITQACEYIGRSRLNTNTDPLRPGRIWKGYNGKFEIKYADDKTPWIGKEIKKDDNRNEYITFERGKEIKIYKTEDEAILDLLGIENDTRSWYYIRDVISKKYPGSKVWRRPIIQAKNLETGEVFEGLRIKDVIEMSGCDIPKSTLTKYMALNQDYKGWAFRFKSEDPWEYGEKRKHLSFAKNVYIKDNFRGKIFSFPSLRRAAEFAQISRSVITNALKNKTPINGRFEVYADENFIDEDEISPLTE